MSKQYKKLVEDVSLKAGGINTQAVTDAKKPIVERALVWIDENVVTYISIVAFILALTYTTNGIVDTVQWLPEKVKGAVILVVVSFITSRAVKQLKKLSSK